MQVAPSNPILQSLSGAEAANGVRPQASAAKTETARAVQSTTKSEASNQTQLRTKREPEDDNDTAPRPRGSVVNIVV